MKIHDDFLPKNPQQFPSDEGKGTKKAKDPLASLCLPLISAQEKDADSPHKQNGVKKYTRQHLLALQKKLARSLASQQNNQSGCASDHSLVIDRGTASAFSVEHEEKQIYLSINGVVQAVSPSEFTSHTKRNGIEVHYLSQLLFNEVKLIALCSGGQPSEMQVPEGHQPPLYLAFINETVGWGAFARRKIEKGELIGEYTGVVTWMGEGNAYTMFYVDLEDSSRIVIDATYYGNETRFINHSERPNASFEFACSKQGMHQRVFIATRTIEEGDQVLTHYGKEYWLGITPQIL